MNVRLEVLAGARLVKADGAIRLERRTAAVLAYLALEGEAVKYRLAAWLWPDSSDNTAHNNMRQLLRRLRNLCGLEVIVGENRIQLSPFVTADATEIQARAFAGDHAGVLEFVGELLDGYEYDDCPDFEEWLRNARDGLCALRRHANAADERGIALGDLPWIEPLAPCGRLEAILPGPGHCVGQVTDIGDVHHLPNVEA